NAVFFDPTNGSIAYAALQAGGIFRSADGGAAWDSLPGTGTKVFPTTKFGRIALAIAPSAPATLYSRVTANSPFGDLLGVWKTTDSGTNWIKQTATPDYCGTSHICWYDNVIAVDPVNASVVYAGGEGNTNLYQTLTGGSSWTLVQNNAGPNRLHEDSHA